MYLGVDGGGTSTSFLLFDHDGKEIDKVVYPSMHFMSVGFDGMRLGFEEVKQYYIQKGYNPDQFEIVMGLGGYGSDPLIRKKIEEAILPVFPEATLMSDSKFAMISSLDNDRGVFLISGTGSIAMYNDGKEVHRQGGFGYHIGDEGSGFWIGKKILESFTKEVDLRSERTDIYTTIMEHFHFKSPYEIIAELSNDEKNYRFKVASLGSLFSQSNNSVIQDIFVNAGIELAHLANGFNIHEKTKIAFGGSVLLNNEVVRKSCIQTLNPYFDVFESGNAVEFAVYLIKNEIK